MQSLVRPIDALCEYVGRFGSFLILPLLVIVSYEVVMRYGFNAPTTWAFEATTLLYGVHFVLAFADTHRHGGHVAIDVMEAKLPGRRRLIVRIAANLLLFLPTIGLLAIWTVIYAADSWGNWEHASTSWAPPLYPFKTIMAIGFVLFLLQGVAKLIRDFSALKSHRVDAGHTTSEDL